MPWQIRMIVTLGLVSAPIQLYVALRVASAIAALSGWKKSRIRAATFFIFLYPVLYPIWQLASMFSGGRAPFNRSSALSDMLLAYPFWIGVAIAVQLSIFFVVMDAARLLLFPLYTKHTDSWLRTSSIMSLLLAASVVIYCLYRVRNDTLTVRDRQTTLQIAGLPDDLDGLRIVQISDLHFDRYTNGDKVQRYIDAAGAESPDLIVFCGDLVSNGTSYISQAASAMGGLKARLGVYACLGDHDYFSDPEMVAASLRQNGIHVIRDGFETVRVGSASICLTGLTNVYMKRATSEAVKDLMASRPRLDLDIFFTHQPSNWLVAEVGAAGYHLFLGGHTHGGQITFPLPGFLLTGSSFETHYVTGFFNVGHTQVSINNGLGMTLAPIRYQAPAEVTLIRVERAR
jgi:predicted MPP superfamily phosphohydrolase